MLEQNKWSVKFFYGMGCWMGTTADSEEDAQANVAAAAQSGAVFGRSNSVGTYTVIPWHRVARVTITPPKNQG